MALENLGGIRALVDRLGLPPRAKYLVAQLEQLHPIDQPPESGSQEVRMLKAYVDGEQLLYAIVAAVLSTIPDELLPVPEPLPEPSPPEALLTVGDEHELVVEPEDHPVNDLGEPLAFDPARQGGFSAEAIAAREKAGEDQHD